MENSIIPYSMIISVDIIVSNDNSSVYEKENERFLISDIPEKVIDEDTLQDFYLHSYTIRHLGRDEIMKEDTFRSNFKDDIGSIFDFDLKRCIYKYLIDDRLRRGYSNISIINFIKTKEEGFMKNYKVEMKEITNNINYTTNIVAEDEATADLDAFEEFTTFLRKKPILHYPIRIDTVSIKEVSDNG